VEAVVEIVRVEDPPAATDKGLRLALTPPVAPETPRLTVPEPEMAVVLTVELAPLPAVTETLDGLAEIVKSGVVDAVETMQLFCEFENSVWTLYVTPSLPTTVPPWPLQMSPISPLVLSYHASGGALAAARPTSASVIVSIISCEATCV
jgi:hypothetical protein